jgi:acetyl esterase
MLREFAKTLRPNIVPPAIHSSEDVIIGEGQRQVPVRLYRPDAATPAPLILFFHGGGWVLCDLDSHDFLCRDLANASGCAVVAVDYRLAPEVPFPGALQDCYLALEYFALNAQRHGLDAGRIAVCGDSAGANLAAAVALKSRDQGGPALRHQALLCPVIDSACNSASMLTKGTGYMLSRDIMLWFWNCYLAKPADASNPLASPARAKILANLPPTSIATAEYDPLLDEAELYADRLRASGVTVIARRYLGMIHDFMTMPHITALARRSIADIGADIAASMRD